MRLSEAWLREWVDPDLDREALCELLTVAGLEVEAVEPVAPPFEGVLVARVLEVAPHPDADRLRLCRVETGGGDPLPVVCGAPNVRPGLLAPLARVGARLPGGARIRRARLRGVVSEGMLCSAEELGLTGIGEEGGLLELPPEAPVGEDLRAWLGLEDVSIELSLTPNRGDCLSVRGVAREVAALTGAALGGPRLAPVATACGETRPVAVEDPKACPRYLGRVVRGLDPRARTPLWLQERLRRSGLRPIHPVVDVTNYVMLELGQPMHAFDLACLHGGVTVRRARGGERLRLLDGREVTLAGGELLIADGSGPVALAGIMGCEGSAVAEGTREVLLEAAFFSPTALAGRARALGLHTDSSHRFERGVDPELPPLAMERATALLLEIAGGEAGPVVERLSREHLPARRSILFRPARAEALLGTALDREALAAGLGRLGLAVDRSDAEAWRVIPPSHRFDLALEEDLVEEAARLHGYQRLPSELPRIPLALPTRPEERVDPERVRALLVERGYHEAVTYSFVDPGLLARLDPGRRPLRLANPIAADLAVMRTTLWAGLLQALVRNRKRQQERVRLFELGRRYLPAPPGEGSSGDGHPVEEEAVVAGLAWGPALPEQWGAGGRPADLFDLKGDVEALLALSGRPGAWRFVPRKHPALHPGRSAALLAPEGGTAGWLGELHPRLVEELELGAAPQLFELRLSDLEPVALPRFRPLSRFPAVRRDLAVVVPEEVPAAELLEAVREAAGEVLQEVVLFDLYRGRGVESGKKSVAMGLTLQDFSRTLTDREVDAVVGRVVALLQQRFQAGLRGS